MTHREQQIVNLTVARHWNARYPWSAQVRRSLSVGIEQSVIDAINTRKTPNLPDARERTCFAVSSELLANKRVSDETYAAAEKTMGLESLVALVALTGSFSMTWQAREWPPRCNVPMPSDIPIPRLTLVTMRPFFTLCAASRR